jgi:hypothetical protein
VSEAPDLDQFAQLLPAVVRVKLLEHVL